MTPSVRKDPRVSCNVTSNAVSFRSQRLFQAPDLCLQTRTARLHPNAAAKLRLKFLLFTGSVVSAPCDPMDCSTPVFPVLHYVLEFAQTRVH